MATEKPSLYDNFTLRGESYKAGMLLLIKYLTEQEWKLGNKFPARLDFISEQIERLYKNYADDFKKEKIFSFKAANESLNNRLLKSYISILDFHTTLENPFQSLLLAERYSVWLKGRRPFETQVIFPVRENDTNPKNLNIVLSEKPLVDQELLFPEYSDNDTLWFKSLATWQQNFIIGNQKELVACSIPSSLRNVPGLANLSYHECKINNAVALSYFRHAAQLPIDLLENKNTDDEQFRLTCLNLASQIRLSLKEKSDVLTSTSELVILSQSILSPGKIASAKAKFFNRASDNDTQIYALKERAVKLFQYALANPETSIEDLKVKALFFTQNEQSENLFYKDFLKKWGLFAEDNKAYQYKPIRFTLLSTNNPFNVLRHFGAYPLQNKHNEFNTALLLGAVARYLNHLFRLKPKINQQDERVERWPQLIEYMNQFNKVESFNFQLSQLIKELSFCEKVGKISANSRKSLVKLLESFFNEEIKKNLDENVFQLLHALHALLSIPCGQGVLASDERHKPQLRSFAETMIVNCLGGVSWVACKSGKDRTGGASIAVDAAAVYYHQNKKFPHYQDNKSDRGNYLILLEELFRSKHQQHVAAENAPGAEGLVKSTYFFPSDLKLDVETVQLETKLARLNKPKTVKNTPTEFFNLQILNEDLQDVKDKTINMTLGTNVTEGDWERNWDVYFINGRSVRELRKNKRFESKQDLSQFIETHLLEQIEDKELKKYYIALVLYSFHQGGFPHTFSKLSMQLINECYQQHNQNAIIGQPDMRINFSWSKDGKGIQIEEINTYKEKKSFVTSDNEVVLVEKGDYYCQTSSCISLNLSKVKNNGYKLAASIQSANVNCTEELLKPVFFLKKSNLSEAFMHLLQLFLAAIKRYFDKLVKLDPVLNERWLSKANSAFFQKSTITAESEKREQQFHLLDMISPDFFIINDRMRVAST
ncbi:MAG: hypothetical protein WAW84_02640 [Candidatus Rickettsiella isopodorum]